MRALIGGLTLALAAGAASGAGNVLDDITRLAVSVSMEQPVDGASPDHLARRVVAFLAELRPTVVVDETSRERLHLTVSVRSYSSSTLRGFPLPFSGRYGIGTVRLSLERPVHLTGSSSRTTAAIVWQRERPVATRWQATATAVAAAVSELLEDLRVADRARR